MNECGQERERTVPQTDPRYANKINAEVERDPWKHRSAGMQCRTCMFFVRKESRFVRTHDIGRCRRHAPSMNGYPVVYDNDWCGDHKLNEEVA